MARRQVPKRMFNGTETSSTYQPGRSPRKLMKTMARKHEDVLQNIEATLVDAWHDDPATDDRVVDAGLTEVLEGRSSEGAAGQIVDRLGGVREMRDDIDDQVWNDALRVVRDSVRRHSALKPGERAYLRFVSNYLP